MITTIGTDSTYFECINVQDILEVTLHKVYEGKMEYY